MVGMSEHSWQTTGQKRLTRDMTISFRFCGGPIRSVTPGVYSETISRTLPWDSSRPLAEAAA